MRSAALRDEVMSLPEKERLKYALELIDELSGSDTEKQFWVSDKLGLTAQQAQIFLVLNAAAPNCVPRSVIFTSVWGRDSDVEVKIVDVFICHMRAKGLAINTHWGVGYSLANKIEVGEMTPEIANRGRRWTEQDDKDLAEMVANGSSIRAMAYELDRTERGINERIMRLKCS
jgi:DNA-binding winged helix-turn-helix (wHTH) protein